MVGRVCVLFALFSSTPLSPSHTSTHTLALPLSLILISVLHLFFCSLTFHLTFQFFHKNAQTEREKERTLMYITQTYTPPPYKIANKIALTKFVFYDANLHICRNWLCSRKSRENERMREQTVVRERHRALKIMGNLKSNTNKMSETKCICCRYAFYD